MYVNHRIIKKGVGAYTEVDAYSKEYSIYMYMYMHACACTIECVYVYITIWCVSHLHSMSSTGMATQLTIPASSYFGRSFMNFQ